MWLLNRKSRSRKLEREFDPFTSGSDPWDPNGGSGAGYAAAGAGAAGAAAGVGAAAAGARTSRRLTRGGGGHAKYAEAGEKDGMGAFPAYAPLAVDGSPRRGGNKVAAADEQDAYYAHVPYAHGGAPHDDGMSAYAYTESGGLDRQASLYDRAGAASAAPQQQQHESAPYAALGAAALGGGAAAAAAGHRRYDEPQHQRAPSAGVGAGAGTYGGGGGLYGREGGYAAAASAGGHQQQQQPQQAAPYGQPGSYMQYPSQYQPYSSAQPSYPPSAPAGAPSPPPQLAPLPGISYHAPSPSSPTRQGDALPLPGQQQQRYSLSDRPMPPSALQPGGGGGNGPLRVVNEGGEDDERARFGARAADMDAYGGLDDGLPYTRH